MVESEKSSEPNYLQLKIKKMVEGKKTVSKVIYN
jgi:hypothetical protein